MTHLQEVAAATPVGAFAVLNQPGDGSGYGETLTSSGQGGIYGFASKAAYDPARNRVFHLAAGHNGGAGNPIKFIGYDVTANTWSSLPLPSWAPANNTGPWHGYQQEGIIGNRFVKGRHNSAFMYACDIDRDNIMEIAASTPAIPDRLIPNPPPQYLNRGCVDGFPERNSAVAFASQGSGNLYEWAGGAIWTVFKTIYRNVGGATLAGDGIAAAHNPVHHGYLIGGGLSGTVYYRQWWWIAATGAMTRIDDCPVDTYAHGRTLFTCDPVSGKFILIRPQLFPSGQGEPVQPGPCFFYELDMTRPTGLQWLRRPELEAGIPQFHTQSPNQVVYTVCVPIPNPGVILFMGNTKTWILKYAATPLPQLPQKPTNLHAVPS